ncbi:lamin tail domain-containing protein 2 [Emydura macquarii macquarii]|uniref:lamin tail domain-containing protein 2 n=1 Tax=Emydura macquarii macquarii TaxID=1129001 RepID=UPI00352B5BFE
MGGRPPENLPLMPGDDPRVMGETQKEDKLHRQLYSRSEGLGEDSIYSQAPPGDTESIMQPAREAVGQGEDDTSGCWILSEAPEQHPKAPPVQQKVLQKDNTHVLRLLLHQRDLEIQGLRRAAQKEPSAQLSFILQELVSMRQRVSATPTRYQTKRDQQEHLQKEIDRLKSELHAEKELHMREIQLLKERLFKSELLVQQLYKEIKRLEKSQPGKPAQGFTEPQETEATVGRGEEPYIETESFELWSEMGNNNNIASEPSNMALRRIPKHTSFLDSFFKDTDPGTLELEKDNGSIQISEVVQGESNFYGMSSIEPEDRWKINDFNNFSSSQELASLPVRKEGKLHSESSLWDVISSPKPDAVSVPSKSEVAVLFPSLPPFWEKIQPKHSGSLDLKIDQSQDLCHLTHAGLGGIGVRKTSAMPSDLSNGKEHERAPGDSGFLKIITVNRKGKFIRILNTSLDQDMDLSGFIIQQWIGGYPVSIYRFPPDTPLPALHHVTVWAAGADFTHKKPTNVTLRAQQYFRTGPECTTVLSNAKGQTLSRYTAPHRLTAAAEAYADNTDLSVDKFPLSGDGEEAEEPLAQKDQQSVPATPCRGSTGRPPGILQQTRDRKYFPVGSLNSKNQGEASRDLFKRKIKPRTRETVHKIVSFSSQNLPPISVTWVFSSLAVKERLSSSSSEEEEEEDFAPCGRQPATAEPNPRVFKTTLDTTIPTVALIGQKSARSKYGFKHMAYLPITTDMQLRRYCPAR